MYSPRIFVFFACLLMYGRKSRLHLLSGIRTAPPPTRFRPRDGVSTYRSDQ